MGLPAATKAFRKNEVKKLIGIEPEAATRPEGKVIGKPFFNWWRLAFLGILILAALIYLPSLKGDKVWDDNGLLDGTSIGGGTSVVSALTKPFLGAYFRPLVSLTFYFENRLWGGNPFLYHQTNILLHVLACAALMGLVLTAFQKRSLALMSGLLFAVQPAQVSTVAWIGGRTDSLCSLLVILFAYTLILGIKSTGKSKFAWVTVSVCSFFLAAVTKEQVAVMILLVPLAAKAFSPDYLKPNLKSYVRLTLPYFFACVVFAVLWFAFNATPFHATSRGLAGQLMTAGRTTVYYSLLFLAPNAKWMHTLSLGTMEHAGLPLACAGIALFVALLAGTAICIKKNPQLGWFAAFVALALLPVSNVLPLPSLLVAPYRAGVAGVGVAVLFAWLITSLSSKQIACAIGSIFVVWCGWLTYWGSTQWKDAVTIFSQFTTEDPYSIVARRNVSGYLLVNSKFKDARDEIQGILTTLYGSDAWSRPEAAYSQFQTDPELTRKVVENQGNEVEPEDWLAELFAQLGFAQGKYAKQLALQGQDNEAKSEFDKSRRSFETAVMINRKNARGHTGLAQFAVFDKNYAVAIQHLRLAIAVHPSDPVLYSQIGDVYVITGDLSKASTNYKQSIAIEPWSAFAYQRLAEVQVKEGRVPAAIETLKSALNCQVLDEQGIKARIGQLERGQFSPRS